MMTAETMRNAQCVMRNFFEEFTPIKIQDNSHDNFKLRAGAKKLQMQFQNYHAYMQALFERLKPIPIEKITRRLCKLY